MKNAFLIIAVISLTAVLAQAQPAPAPTPAKSASPESSPLPATTTPVKAGRAAITLPPEKLQPVKMVRFEKPPVIDGKLDDEIWKLAVVLKDFYQVQPGDNLAPSKPTEVLLGYDPKFLYIAFRCYDEPDKVRATIPKRDNIWDDDYVGILFDTFNDQRKAYEFNFSPAGVQADGIWTDGQGEDFSPDIVMESKGIITPDGWTVEVAIPFKSLRYVAGKDKLWGAHFWRRIKRFNNELDMWMPLDRDKSNWLSQAGHLSGFDGISTERTLELIPSLTLSETGTRKGTLTPAQLISGMLDPGRMVNAPIRFDPGLTGKYTLTPTVILDFAVNPDFAQVESDQLVVQANQRFPIFFEEKRPFFLEGKDIFTTQIAAVHTRAIIDPDIALKISGKVDRNTFGLMVASDNGPGNLSEDDREFIIAHPAYLLGITDPINNPPDPASVAGIQRAQAQLARLLDKNALIGILRLKRDIGKEDSYIGFLGTHYSFIDRYNNLGGFDGRFRFDKQTTLSWQMLGTRSRRPFFFPEQGQVLDRRENGFIYAWSYDKDGRNFGYNLSGVGRTRYYRAEVGFNRRPNSNSYNYFFRYNSDPKPKAKLVSWRVYDAVFHAYDWQGRAQSFNNESQIQFSFPRQSYLGVGFDKGYERVFESEFGPIRQPGSNCVFNNNCTFAGEDNERSAYNHGLYLFAGSNINKKYSFNMFLNRRWGDLDFDFGAGPKFPRVSPSALLAQAARAADQCPDPITGVFSTACNGPLDPGPGDFLHFDAQVNYQPTNAIRATLSYTKERLTRYDTNRVAFDENIVSLRATYQFTRFIFARGRIDFDSLASNYKGQFLFGWTPNPGTAFYAGYNDDLSRNGFNPFTNQLEPGFRRNGRTFFIKMSYLFRRSF